MFNASRVGVSRYSYGAWDPVTRRRTLVPASVFSGEREAVRTVASVRSTGAGKRLDEWT